VSLPRIHVVVAGIEKVIPRFEDLAVCGRCWRRSALARPSPHTQLVGGRLDAAAARWSRGVSRGATRQRANNACWLTPNNATPLHCIRCGGASTPVCVQKIEDTLTEQHIKAQSAQSLRRICATPVNGRTCLTPAACGCVHRGVSRAHRHSYRHLLHNRAHLQRKLTIRSSARV